jgi:type III secretory pathway component EscS
MNPLSLGEIMQGFVVVVILVSGPIVGAALLIGILVGLLQAVTQIQDQSIAYGVKIVTVALLIIVLGRWMGQEMLGQFDQAFKLIPQTAFANRSEAGTGN